MKKYITLPLAIALIAIIITFFNKGVEQGKQEKKIEILEKKVQKTQIIVKQHKKINAIKIKQQKLISKPDDNINVTYRRQWLQLVYKKRNPASNSNK